MTEFNEADRAAEILKELIKTPYMTSIYFEFREDAFGCPMVKYTIERAVGWEDK